MRCAFITVLMLAATPLQAAFTYDSEQGLCRDENGQQGLNALDVNTLFANPELAHGTQPTWTERNAECVDFAGFNAHDLSRAHGYTGYLRLKGWNLRGASLSGASWSFVSATDASLAGTDLSQLQMGYTTITGTIDSYTRLAAPCKTQGEKVRCVR